MARSHLTLRSLTSRLAALTKTAFLTAAMLTAAPVAALAESAPDNIYMVVVKDPVKPIVVFVFSDSTKAHYSPKDAAAFYAIPGYKVENGVWDPVKACDYTFDYTTDFPFEAIRGPVYGPGSDQRIIDPLTLPSFMARESVKALLATGVAANEAEAAPYFNCAGFVWSQLLKMTPEAWQKVMREQFELQVKGKQ